MNTANEEKQGVVDEVFEAGELTAQEREAMGLLVARLEEMGAADAREADGLRVSGCGDRVREEVKALTPSIPLSSKRRESTGGWLRRWAVPAGLAAALLLGVGIGYQGRGGGMSAEPVAWAQVVEAFEKRPSFHVTMVIERPGAMETEDRMMRAELYYKSPGKWRAMIPGFVEFNKGGTKAGQVGFDTKDKTRTEGDKMGAGRLLPKLLHRWNKKQDMLDAMVGVVFMLPADAPAPKVERVGSKGGVEVFDYVVNAREKWARVWVTKESRLPIQVKVFDPTSNGLMLMTFDYDDPQPDAFFDADVFEKALKMSMGTEPARARLGMGETGGKPTAPEQIVKRVEDLVSPKLVGVYGDADGRIVIETTNTNNRKVFGWTLVEWEGVGNVRDNWGNTYRWANTFEAPGGTTKTFYVPDGTLKRGSGARMVSYEYRVSGRVVEKETQRLVGFSKVLLSGSEEAGFALPATMSARGVERLEHPAGAGGEIQGDGIAAGAVEAGAGEAQGGSGE
jgi:outer membrane lipoprotein-sorting protein